jgi:DNA-binding MarR family transcriptional regulator
MQTAHITRRTANFIGALGVVTEDFAQDAAQVALGQGPEAAAALVTLDKYPGRPIEFLRHALGRSHSATARLVDRLQRDGLLERRRATDARATALHLTKSGARAVTELRRAREQRLIGLVLALEPDERRTLERLLERLLVAATSDRASTRRICRLCDEHTCERHARCPVDQAAPR